MYDGQWITTSKRDEFENQKRIKREKEEADRKAKEQLEAQFRDQHSHPNIIVHAQGGQAFDIAGLVGQGRITVIDFYAGWCGPCKRMAPQLKSLVMQYPDVLVHKIDIVNWTSPVAQQYHLSSIPNLRVFNRDGKLIGRLTGSIGAVAEYVRQAN
ncbi:MAG: thioredoxin family protein [Lentisphaerota bacterium]